MQNLQSLETEIIAAIKAAENLDSLENLRVTELGKKSRVSLLMRELGAMSPEDKIVFGPKLNGLKMALNDAIQNRKNLLEEQALNAKLQSERIDITLSAVPENKGSIHPISQVMDEVTEIFTEMGFSVAE